MLKNYFQKETIRKHLDLLICLFLALVTAVIYWQVKNFAFVSYDDLAYIPNNSHVRSGLTLKGISWAFTTFYESNWHPLTWLSHMMDVELFGLMPAGHHLVNVFIHIANTILLFLILKRMTSAVWQSAFVAALFALHPLHVESVAWVAERKDVLSAFFWILTIGAYAQYAEKPNAQRYLLTLLFFILGLMSKPMIVTLPFTLLLLDYWPLKRFSFDRQGDTQEVLTTGAVNRRKKKRKGQSSDSNKISAPSESIPSLFPSVQIRPLLLEKIPLLILSAASSIITYVAQQKGGAMESLQNLPLMERIANATVAYIIYLFKMCWPLNLAVLYPHPVTYPIWQSLGAAFLLTVITLSAIAWVRRFPYFTMGWFWYLITLIPVIGLVQVGVQAWADRYTYIPLVGIFMAMAWGISELTKQWSYRNKILSISAGIVIFLLTVLSWQQIQFWKDDFSLYPHAIRVTENNDMAHNNLGTTYYNKGDLDRAMRHYRVAVEINPQKSGTYYNMGNVLADQGHFQEAMDQYAKALQFQPSNVAAHNDFGNVLMLQGRYDKAIEHLQEAIRIAPDYAKSHGLLGHIFAEQGKRQEAIKHYKMALQINPKLVDVHYNLGTLLANQGQMDEATRHFAMAVQLDPNYAKAHNNLGMALLIQGRIDNAIFHFQEALRADPKNDLARKNLQDALARKK